MGNCRSDETLRMFGDDGLDSAVAADVAEHIKVCPTCQTRLERLAWECPTPMNSPPCPLPVVGESPDSRF